MWTADHERTHYASVAFTCTSLFYVCLHKGAMSPASMHPPRFFFYAVDNRAIGSKMWRVPDSAIDALFWSPPPLWGGGM